VTHEHTYSTGLKLRIETQDQDVIDHLVQFYERNKKSLAWECPFCEGDIDSVCYELDDGIFEDTYDCDAECEILLTFLTPKKYGEYHKVPIDEVVIEVEFMFGGRPASWHEDEYDEAGGHAENYGDGHIPPSPNQMALFDIEKKL
jgi:hypothetical protein